MSQIKQFLLKHENQNPDTEGPCERARHYGTSLWSQFCGGRGGVKAWDLAYRGLLPRVMWLSLIHVTKSLDRRSLAWGNSINSDVFRHQGDSSFPSMSHLFYFLFPLRLETGTHRKSIKNELREGMATSRWDVQKVLDGSLHPYEGALSIWWAW